MQSIIKRKQITIGGVAGSGKSTVAKKLAEELKYLHYSSGDYARALALEAGFNSITDFLAVNRNIGKELDEKIDLWIKNKKLEEKFVIDSRLAFLWIPDSFKVFLTLNPRVAAERSFKDGNKLRKSSEKANSLEEAMEDIIRRQNNDVNYYKELYGINLINEINYDLIVDTGLPEYDGKPENVFQKIYSEYQIWIR